MTAAAVVSPPWREAARPGVLLQPGVVPLLTVHEGQPALWACVLGAIPPDAPECADTVGLTDSFERARAAVAATAEILLCAVDSLELPARLAQVSGPYGTRSLRGASGGLAFALAVTSFGTQLGVPSTIAAIGEIAAGGAILPVSARGLREKLRHVRQQLHGITTVLVPTAQAGVARSATDGAVRIVPCDRLEDAVQFVFPALEQRLVAKTVDEGNLLAHARDLRSLALRGRGQMADWHPIIQMVRALLRAIRSGSSVDERCRPALALAEHIACRYEGETPQSSVSLDDAMRDLPSGLDRVRAVCQLTQQRVDTGWPSADWLARARADALPAQAYLLDEHLKLLGAHARLEEVDGTLQDASQLAEDVIEWWLATDDANGPSHALSHRFRLAAVHADAAGRDRAERFYREWTQRSRIHETSRSFVDVERAFAALRIGADIDDAVQVLHGVACNARLPRHLRLRAARLRWAALAGEPADALELHRKLINAPRLLSSGQAELGLALVALHAKAASLPVPNDLRRDARQAASRLRAGFGFLCDQLEQGPAAPPLHITFPYF